MLQDADGVDTLLAMIIGAHFLVYSADPEADHPGTGFAQDHVGRRLTGLILYLMCDDLRSLMRSLEAKNIACGPVTEAGWGIATTIPLPSGGEIGLYQPTHATAIGFTGG